MLKVVHINTFCTGGAAKAAIRLCDCLVQSGADSKTLVLYKTFNSNLLTDFRKELRPVKNLHLKIKNRNYTDILKWKNRKRIELFSVYHAVWDVAKHSYVKEADVVNLHWVAGFIDFESFFSQVNKKIVITLHDFFPFSGGPHYPNEYFDSEKWQAEIKKNLELLRTIYSKKEIHFVGPSHYILNNVIKSGVAPNAKFHVIKNPVETTIYNKLDRAEIRKQFGLKETDKVLLYVNEDFKYKRKGFALFKPMVRPLLAKGYKIIIVGDHTSKLDGNENIIQTKYLATEKELARAYNAADALLFTSVLDNLPNTISESLCCGTPVISFNNGGINEMIKDGENGLLVSQGNRGEFLKKIDQLFNMNLDREKIWNEAQRIYDYKEAAKKYLSVYNG
jgi:glycosyltransferase involved in cell wall biosynthesis